LSKLKELEGVLNTPVNDRDAAKVKGYLEEFNSIKKMLNNPLMHVLSGKLGTYLALKDFYNVQSDNSHSRGILWMSRLTEFWSLEDKNEKAKSDFEENDDNMLKGLLTYEGYMLSEYMWNDDRFLGDLKTGLTEQKTLLGNDQNLSTVNPSAYIQLIALIKMHKVYNMKKERVLYGNRLKVNKVIQAAVNVGATGTQCMCFNGEVYDAGDHMNAGATFNCVGGIIGKFEGPDKKYAAKKVVCGVNHESIETKHILARVCNGLRLTWVRGFIQRYKFMTNYMVDQYQRWGVHNDDLPGLSEEEVTDASVVAKKEYDIHNLDVNSYKDHTKYSFLYPIIRRNFNEIMSIM